MEDDDFNLPRGPLSAYLGVRNSNQRAGLRDTQNATGLMSILTQGERLKQSQLAMQEDAQIKTILAQSGGDLNAALPLLTRVGPKGIQVAGVLSQLQKQKAEAAGAQRETAFYSPENQAQYQVPGESAIPAPADELGGGPARPAGAPSVDIDRFRRDAAMLSPKGMETYSQHLSAQATATANREAMVQSRRDALEAKLYDIEQRAADRSQTREQQLFLANQANQTRRELAAMAASLRQPPQAQVVQGAEGPMILGRDGVARPVMGESGQPVKGRTGEKPVTEFQGKNMLYGTRAAQAHNVLKELEDNIFLPGLAAKQSAQSTPIVGGMLGAAGNTLLSADQQSVEQAQRNFVNAVLRQESGAVISDAEFENARKQYFPQVGDTAQVRNQKRQNRLTAVSGFQRIAGPAGGEVSRALSQPSLAAQNKGGGGGAAQQVPPPPPGFVVDDR